MAKRPLTIPDRSLITDDTPLRLAVAAEVAFPQGGMTASGLRKERDAGRLVTELVAGREFTTLGDITRMREMCRRTVKEPKPRLPEIDTDHTRAQAALELTLRRLITVDDERRKAEREARQKEREAIGAARTTGAVAAANRRRSPKV